MDWRKLIAPLSISVFLYLALSLWIDREDFGLLMGCVTALFVLYLFLVKQLRTFQLSWIVLIAILLRIPLFLSPPTLSDDVYRFLWDGRCVEQGYNPYLDIPADLAQASGTPIDPTGELIEKMNSPLYYSVYTPINQLIFASIIGLSGDGNTSNQRGIFFYHIFFLLVDVLSMSLLFRILESFGRPGSIAALYGLNPLLILESTGNFHFESLVGLLLLLTVFFWIRKPRFRWLSSVFLGLASGLKLVPVVLFPLHLRSKEWKTWICGSLAFAIAVLSLIPVFIYGGRGFGESLNLYFGNFEFNASIYYIIREIGEWIIGYNAIAVISPVLGIVFFSFTIWYSSKGKGRNDAISFFAQAAWIWAMFYLLNTTVHPWYLIPLLMLGILARLWFPIVWSFVVFLSYSHYWNGGFEEQYILIALEYALVFWAMYIDLKPKNRLAIRLSGSLL